MACELHLMGHSQGDILKEDKVYKIQEWHDHLKKLRYKNTLQRDQSLDQNLKKLPWPLGTEVRQVRRGDLSGFEIKAHIHSQAAFKKHLHGLQHVCNSLEQEPHQLWSPE